MISGQRSNCFFPGDRVVRRCCRTAVHHHFASRLHYQFRVRLLNSEKAESVSKIVHSLGDRCRGWLDVQFALCQPMARKRTRLEARHVVPDRDRILVLVCGSMNNFVDHRPMVIGKVRAWLKYLLDKLFDHEGSNRSKLSEELLKPRKTIGTIWRPCGAWQRVSSACADRNCATRPMRPASPAIHPANAEAAFDRDPRDGPVESPTTGDWSHRP